MKNDVQGAKACPGAGNWANLDWPEMRKAAHRPKLPLVLQEKGTGFSAITAIDLPESNGTRSYRQPPMQLARLRSSERLSLHRSAGLEGWRKSDTAQPSPGRDHDLANEPWDCECQGKHRQKFA